MATKHLVLLPGLDGTGKLFADFLVAIPNTVASTVVAYPTNRMLSHTELFQLISTAVPKTESFVLLGESYSTPIALKFAANPPVNLAGVVICAGFVRKPVGNWSGLLKLIANPWIFRLRPPRFFSEYFLSGKNTPLALIQQLHQVLQMVDPNVLSGRVQEVLACDARRELAQIAVPILYMYGTHDRLLSKSCPKEILRIRPDILSEAIEGAPHMLLQRLPNKTANLVAAFMAKS